MTYTDSFDLALYIHWPFCAKKCPYCDFNSHVREQVDQQAWALAMVDEVAHYAVRYPNARISSIFFGGGTPSLMPPATTAAILEAVDRRWGLAADVEVTLEANPSSVEAGRFQGYRSAGVNRLSVGVQSLDDDALRFLGRLHSADEALSALKVARDTFDRVSIDLLYCRPEQSLKDWAEELDRALEFDLSHLSLYQLTLEPGTGFYGRAKRGELVLPDDDHAADLFAWTQARTAEAGLPAYETSNHARRSEESRHNLTYWTGGYYAGIGPGAHGRLPGGAAGAVMAQANIRRPEAWLDAVTLHGHSREDWAPVRADERFEELIMMGLRLREGLNFGDIHAQTGIDPGARLAPALSELEGHGLIERTAAGVRATDSGWPVVGGLVTALLA